MNLPNFPETSPEFFTALAQAHGVEDKKLVRLPDSGTFNTVYALGNLIIRIPRQHQNFTAACCKEAQVVPTVRAAGVRTPRLIEHNDSLEHLPVPYSVYERAHGETLSLLPIDRAKVTQLWQEVGRNLAKLHSGVAHEEPLTAYKCEPLPDPRCLPEELADDGLFTGAEAAWLEGWLEKLAPYVTEEVPPVFLHGDVKPSKIVVEPHGCAFVALLGWGRSGWGDPAWDFGTLPLRAAPALLAGYREVAPMSHDDTAEARILWRVLQLALFKLRSAPQPERGWAERPMSLFIESMRFCLNPPEGRWRDLLPNG